MIGRGGRRPVREIGAVVLGSSMAFSGLWWNLLSDSFATRLTGVFPGMAPDRASAAVDVFASLWSLIGLMIILVTMLRLMARARRR